MKIGEYRKEDKISCLYSASNCENDLDLYLLLVSLYLVAFDVIMEDFSTNIVLLDLVSVVCKKNSIKLQ